MTSTILPRSELTTDITGWQGGTGQPLLLIHGVGLCADAWGAMLPGLADGFHISAVDLPGHGQSATFPDRPSLIDYTDRLAQVLDRPAFIVGHSMGALIAMDMAVRHPALVRAIAPLNPIFRRSSAASEAVRSRASQLEREWNPDPSGTLERWFGANPKGAMATARDDCRSWLTSVDPTGYAQAYNVFACEDGPTDTALAGISCPALFVTGSDEPNSTPAMSKALAKAVPSGTYAITQGAKHMMPMTHAAEVCAVLTEFFKGHSHE